MVAALGQSPIGSSSFRTEYEEIEHDSPHEYIVWILAVKLLTIYFSMVIVIEYREGYDVAPAGKFSYGVK